MRIFCVVNDFLQQSNGVAVGVACPLFGIVAGRLIEAVGQVAHMSLADFGGLVSAKKGIANHLRLLFEVVHARAGLGGKAIERRGEAGQIQNIRGGILLAGLVEFRAEVSAEHIQQGIELTIDSELGGLGGLAQGEEVRNTQGLFCGRLGGILGGNGVVGDPLHHLEPVHNVPSNHGRNGDGAGVGVDFLGNIGIGGRGGRLAGILKAGKGSGAGQGDNGNRGNRGNGGSGCGGGGVLLRHNFSNLPTGSAVCGI